jgi:hypothetical protein
MMRREYAFLLVLAVCTVLTLGLVYVAAQPAGNRPEVTRGIARENRPPEHRRAVASPLELSLGLAEPAEAGAPVTLVISMSSWVPINSGMLTLRVPEIAGEPNRTEVLWAGAAAEGVAETIQYPVGILPPGQYEFAAILELTPAADNAREITLSQCLYLDVRPTVILSSNVSFEQIQRVELRQELERRIALSLQPELAIASEDAVSRALARLKAADPGLLDRRIEELKATDPDVARRILALNEQQAEPVGKSEATEHSLKN